MPRTTRRAGSFEPSSVFVVVPAYNESDALGQTLNDLACTGHNIVVVDDGSTDGTWEIIARSPVFGLRHPVNLGAGAAVQTGTTFALSQAAEFIVHFDADGQHRAEDIATLLAPLAAGQADVALGSRFLNQEMAQAVPPLRRAILKIAILVNGVLTGVWLSDAHNGLRAFTRAAAEKIHLHENRYAYATEIITLIKQQRLRMVERPVLIRYTNYSTAKGQSLWNSFNIVLDIILRRLLR